MSRQTDWKHVKFGDVVKLNRDRVADPAAEGIERYVGIEHIEPEDLRIRSWGLVAEGTTFTNYFQPGQVLFVKRRAYQRKVAVADFSGVCSGDIYVLEPKDPQVLLPELLSFICQTESFFEHAVGTSAGSLSPRTNWKQLANYEFALPPLEEQRLLSRMLCGIERILNALNLARKSNQTLLNSLREHHFGNVRLGHSNNKLPIKEISTKVTKGESPKWQGFNYVEEGTRFITSENVLNGYLSFEPEKFVPVEFGEKLSRSKLEEGDLLLNIVGGSIGRICVVPSNINDANINQAVALVRPDPNRILSNYLLSYLLTPSINFRLCNRSVDDYKPNLSLTSIRNFELTIPPTNIQKEHLSDVKHIQDASQNLSSRQQQVSELKEELLDKLNIYS